MRILAITLNGAAVFLIIVLIIINSENISKGTIAEWLTVITILAFLVFNIVALAFSHPFSHQGWLARFLERKKLEELKRIKALEKEIKENENSN